MLTTLAHSRRLVLSTAAGRPSIFGHTRVRAQRRLRIEKRSADLVVEQPELRDALGGVRSVAITLRQRYLRSPLPLRSYARSPGRCRSHHGRVRPRTPWRTAAACPHHGVSGRCEVLRLARRRPCQRQRVECGRVGEKGCWARGHPAITGRSGKIGGERASVVRQPRRHEQRESADR
jgi:hypothetical protein